MDIGRADFQEELMKTAGIIAEYNPFHNGHQRQLSFVREQLGADYIIAVMSGDFVQRGTPALLPKHIRAEAALRCGVDLVLELPVSASSASAELFARCGVDILDGIGVTDVLCFGSEEGEIPLFLKTAEILQAEPETYRKLLKDGLKSGLSFPLARSMALSAYMYQEEMISDHDAYDQFLTEPNNILGIEYCKALLHRKSRIRPVTLKRMGAGYHEQALTKETAPSASGIRSRLKDNRAGHFTETALNGFLPEASLKLLISSQQNNSLVFEKDLDLLLAYCLFSETQESLCQYLDVSSELASRIIRMRNQYSGFLQFAALLKTKELTQTRIQRALLHILLHIRSVPDVPGYARVLGFRKSAAPLLSAIKREGNIPLITKAADASRILSGQALRAFDETVFASNIYGTLLSAKNKKPFVHEYQKPVVII